MKWPQARLVFVAVLTAAASAGFYAYYQQLIAEHRQSFINEAGADLSEVAGLLGDRLADWRIAIHNAAWSDDHGAHFGDHVRHLMPSLRLPYQESECQNASATPAPTVTEDVASASIVSRHGIPVFEYQSKGECVFTAPDFLPSMLNRLYGTFDSVLISSEDGEVRYQSHGSGPHAINLEGLLISTDDGSSGAGRLKGLLNSILSTGSSASGSGNGATAVAAILRQLSLQSASDQSSFPNMLPVRISGEDYLMFIQPLWQLRVGTGAAGNSATGNSKGHVLSLVGFISNRELSRRASTWPTSATGWVLLLLLLVYGAIFALSCVPMKPRTQPVRPRDVVQMGISILICCACLTLAVTHLCFSGSQVAKDTDLDTKQLARSVSRNLAAELVHLYHLLDMMSQTEELKDALRAYHTARKPGVASQTNLLTRWDATTSPRHSASSVAYLDPFFDYIIWSDGNGGQIDKWTTAQVATPPADMTQFQWFVDGMHQKTFELRSNDEHERTLIGDHPASVVVTGENSISTGEFLSILMKRVELADGEEIAGTLVAPLTSVNAPVMPAGYDFDVVSANGAVLFSSRRERSKQSNVLHDCGPNARLEQALLTNTNDALLAVCSGTNVRMYAMPFEPLAGAHWSIVTRRDMNQVSDTEATIFVQAMLLAVPYIAAGALFVALLWVFFRAGRRERLWPTQYRFGNYFSAVVTLVPAVAFGIAVLEMDSRSVAYFEMPVIPILSVSIVLSLLLERTRQAVCLASLFSVLAVVNIGADDLRLDRAITQVAIAVVLAVTATLLRRVFLVRQAPIAGQEAQAGNVLIVQNPKIVMAFLHAAVSSLLLFACASLPIFCCYRVASEIVLTTVAMRDLSTTSDRIAARTRAIRAYYSDIQRPASGEDWFVKDWLAHTSDRYDSEISSRAMPYAEGYSGHANEEATRPDGAMLVDRFVSRVLFSEAPAATKAKLAQQFVTGHQPFVQLDSSGTQPDLSDQPVSGWWSARSLAARVPDSNPFSREMLTWGLVPATIVFALLVWLGKSLFFLNIKYQEPIPPVAPEELTVLRRNVILLHLAAAALDELRELPGLESMTCSDLTNPVTSRRRLTTGGRPLLLTGLNLPCATRKSAAAYLDVLECAMEGGRHLILASAVDPARFIRETVHSGEAHVSQELREYFIETEARWERLFLCLEYRQLNFDFESAVSLEGAGSVARRIYASCTDEQSALIYQLASNAWCNPNNKGVARSLMARGWLEMEPMPRLLWPEPVREALGNIVSGHDVKRWEAAEKTSGWHLGVTALAFVLFAALLFAGRSLLQSIPAGAIAMIGGAVAPLIKALSESRTRITMGGKTNANVG